MTQPNQHGNPVIRQVVAYVMANEPVTFDQVQQAFPQVRRATLQKALQNSQAKRELFCIRKGVGSKFGSKVSSLWRGAKPGDYAPQVRPLRPIARSVWDLATPLSLVLRGEGQRYSPLGAWHEREGA